MTPSWAYAGVLVLAGIGIPMLAALNASLGVRIGSPWAAAVVLFTIALGCAVLVAVITGPGPLTKVPAAPRQLLLADVLISFYVLSITYVAPRFGVGNAVFFVLLGQLVSAAMIDHFWLFGAKLSPLSLTRATGIAVMAFGVWITQRG